MGISDDTTLTTADKAKIKEEYGLWEQKTGINAKEGGVGILGIRTRQLMHERRLELLEALRDKPCTLSSALYGSCLYQLIQCHKDTCWFFCGGMVLTIKVHQCATWHTVLCPRKFCYICCMSLWTLQSSLRL